MDEFRQYDPAQWVEDGLVVKVVVKARTFVKRSSIRLKPALKAITFASLLSIGVADLNGFSVYPSEGGALTHRFSAAVVNALAERIHRITSDFAVEPEIAESIEIAKSQAINFALAELPAELEALVNLSEDGVLTLQMRSPNKGILVMFTGDEVATYAVKSLGGHYATNIKEFDVAKGPPRNLRKAIDLVINETA